MYKQKRKSGSKDILLQVTPRHSQYDRDAHFRDVKHLC